MGIDNPNENAERDLMKLTISKKILLYSISFRYYRKTLNSMYEINFDLIIIQF